MGGARARTCNFLVLKTLEKFILDTKKVWRRWDSNPQTSWTSIFAPDVLSIHPSYFVKTTCTILQSYHTAFIFDKFYEENTFCGWNKIVQTSQKEKSILPEFASLISSKIIIIFDFILIKKFIAVLISPPGSLSKYNLPIVWRNLKIQKNAGIFHHY